MASSTDLLKSGMANRPAQTLKLLIQTGTPGANMDGMARGATGLLNGRHSGWNDLTINSVTMESVDQLGFLQWCAC